MVGRRAGRNDYKRICRRICFNGPFNRRRVVSFRQRENFFFRFAVSDSRSVGICGGRRVVCDLRPDCCGKVRFGTGRGRSERNNAANDPSGRFPAVGLQGDNIAQIRCRTGCFGSVRGVRMVCRKPADGTKPDLFYGGAGRCCFRLYIDFAASIPAFDFKHIKNAFVARRTAVADRKKSRPFPGKNLDSGRTQEVLYTLRIIEEAQSALFPVKLRQALHHKNEDVRLYALTKIEQLGFSSALKEVEELADKDNSFEVRRMALRVMCHLGDDAAREKAIGLIDDPDMREGALTGLIAAGHEGVFTAIERTAALAASTDPADRQMAAVVLGCAGNPAFYRPLIHLLNDDDQDVCQVALFAAGRLQNRKLLPAIMETFRFPELREDGITVLLQFGEKAFPEIEKYC